MTAAPETFVAIGALLARARDLDDATNAIEALRSIRAKRIASPSLDWRRIPTMRATSFRSFPTTPRSCSSSASSRAHGRSAIEHDAARPGNQWSHRRGRRRGHRPDDCRTMIGLIVGARSRLRIFSPSSTRAVSTSSPSRWRQPHDGACRSSVGYARRGNRDNAIEQLEERVRANGNPARFQTVAIESDRPSRISSLSPPTANGPTSEAPTSPGRHSHRTLRSEPSSTANPYVPRTMVRRADRERHGHSSDIST